MAGSPVRVAVVLIALVASIPFASAEGAPYTYARGGWSCLWFPGAGVCDGQADGNTGAFSLLQSNSVWPRTTWSDARLGHWIYVPPGATTIEAEADIVLSEMVAITTPTLARGYVTVQLLISSPTCHDTGTTCLTATSEVLVPFDTTVPMVGVPQVVHVEAMLVAPAGLPQRIGAQDGEVHVRITAVAETTMFGSATVYAAGVVTDVTVRVS